MHSKKKALRVSQYFAFLKKPQTTTLPPCNDRCIEKGQLQGHTLVMRRPPTCMQELSTPVVPVLYRLTPVACVTISLGARKFCYINIL